MEGVVVDKMFFRFAMCASVPEIFAIKVESCQKSRRILDVFSPSQILGGRPSKSYTHFITHTSRYVAWKWFCKDTPISPEVLVAQLLNFKPNFKFSRLKFFGGNLTAYRNSPTLFRSPSVVMCASKAWSICNACKNLMGQHPSRAEM